MKKRWFWGCLGSILLLLSTLLILFLILRPGLFYLIPISRIHNYYAEKKGIEERMPVPVNTLALDLPKRIIFAGHRFDFFGSCPKGTPDLTGVNFTIVQYSSGGTKRLFTLVVNEKYCMYFTFPLAGLYSIRAELRHGFLDKEYAASPIKFVFVLPRFGQFKDETSSK